jgi:opacity protein-like surface antigen
MRNSSRLSALAVGLVLGALPALAADVAGKWTAEFDTQVGLQKYTYDLKVEGEKVTGKAFFERMGQKGEADLLEGTLKGDQISFVEMLDFQGNSIRITYTGTVKGDEMALTRQVGEFATEQIVVRRAKN